MKARLCGWACAMSAVALLFAGVLSVSAQAQTVYSQSVCDDVDDVIQPLFNILKAFSMVEGSLIYKSEAGPFGTTHPSETIHWQLTFGPNLEVYSICGYSTVRIGPSARVWSSDQGPVSGGMRLQAGMSINASQTCLTNWSFREFNIPGLSDLLDAVGTLVHADISTTDLANAILSVLQAHLLQPSSICVDLLGGGPPIIDLIIPNSGPPGAMVTVNGSGFHQGGIGLPIEPASVVRFDGSSLSTTYVSSTGLQFTVPSDAACGPHNVQVNNPLSLNRGVYVSEVVIFTVTSPCSGGGGTGPSPSNQAPSADFSFTPATPNVSQMVQFTDQSTDPDGAADIVLWSWDLGDGMTSTTQRSEDFPSTTQYQHTYNTAATFTVHLTVKDSAGQTSTAIKSVTVSMGGQPPPPPPSGGGSSSLKSFDTNNNNVIDDAEFFAIIDAWIAGQVDDATFFQAVDLWVSQSPISSAGLSQSFRLDAVTLASTSAWHSMTFMAHGPGITSMRVEIFDLNGTRIFSQEAAGTRLTWNLRAPSGHLVAHGVYLYRVTVRGINGEKLGSEVKKLLV